MPDKILSRDQLKQLDGNIRKMISDGLGRSDVEAYARDFREKFAKEERPAPANLERSMRPTFPTLQEKLKEKPVAATPEQQINKYDKAVIDDRSRAGRIAATIYNGLVGSLESLAGFGAELGSAYAAVPSQQQLISQIATSATMPSAYFCFPFSLAASTSSIFGGTSRTILLFGNSKTFVI